MGRPGGFAQIVQKDDGSRIAIWGIYELRSAFQPIFAFDDDAKVRIAAFECLIRPFRAGAPVSPHRFFSSVEADERGEIETLTRNLHLLNAGVFLDPSASIFVNFDPSQFPDRETVDEALRDMRLMLHEAKLDAARIVCELTEQKSKSPLALQNLMMSLRDHGFRIAVDDFGAEDSDYERIVKMQPDIVKFDAAWVKKLLDSASGYSLLKSMITKVSCRGIETVIEGIEEPWQLELTEKSGAMMVQGFGLARPQIAPSEFAFHRPVQIEETPPLTSDQPAPSLAANRKTQASFGRRR